jgi:hypothetical protein
MNEQQIQEQLTKEYNDFLIQPFEGIPEWMIEKFPIALMSIPQSAVQYHAERIQLILSKKREEITIFECGLLVNCLLAAKPEVFGWPIEEFLLRRLELEGIRAEFTELTKKEETRLKKKQAALAGMGGQMKNNNGLSKVK